MRPLSNGEIRKKRLKVGRCVILITGALTYYNIVYNSSILNDLALPETPEIQSVEKEVTDLVVPETPALQSVEKEVNDLVVPETPEIQSVEKELNDLVVPETPELQSVENEVKDLVVPETSEIQSVEKEVNDLVVPETPEIQSVEKEVNNLVVPETSEIQSVEKEVNDLVVPERPEIQSVGKEVRNGGNKSSVQECREQWDRRKNEELINQWLEMEVPIFVDAIRHNRAKKEDTTTTEGPEHSVYYKNTKDDIVYAIFTQRHLVQAEQTMDFHQIPWMCVYRGSDERGQGRYIQESGEIVPRTRNFDMIFVICNATSENSTILEGAFPTTVPFQNRTDRPAISTMNTVEDGIEFYSFEEPLMCDRLEEDETRVKHKNKKIGACLRFQGEFDRSIVPEWIEYHRLIGVEHFWVYINEKWNLTGLIDRPYITYVPFDFNWKNNNHTSHFRRPYSDYMPEISQEPASYSCLLNARKYDYDWIITTDVDEFIRAPKSNNMSPESPSPLQSYMQRFDPDQYSCFIMNSIPFGRNKWVDTSDLASDHMMIDYVWRRNMSLSDYPLQHQKQIYNPKHVWSFGVHYCWIADGKKNVKLAAKDGLFVQHYKRANEGVSKKGKGRFIRSPNALMKDTTVQDMYRSDLRGILNGLEGEGFFIQ